MLPYASPPAPYAYWGLVTNHFRNTAKLREKLGVVLLAVVISSVASAQRPALFQGTTTVGHKSQAISVLVALAADGVSLSPEVQSQGVTGADFAIAPGGTCAPNTSYTAGQQCVVSITFQPKYPGLRTGVVVLQDANGNVLGSTLLAGSARGSLAVLEPGRIDTLAGDLEWVYRGDGVPATQAPIFLPTGVAVDLAGDLYLSDSSNNRLRRVDVKTGLISTVAGNGSPGFSGNGGPATQAMVSAPAGLALDGAGDIYFADSGNHCVRRVDAFTGIITTFAGVCGTKGYAGDGGAAASATLSLPQGIAFDSANNLYLADTGNNVVRMVGAGTGIIRTLAGTGAPGYNGDNQPAAAAQLNSPWNVAIGADNSIYVADFNNNRIRAINPAGTISTVAGSGTRGFAGDGAGAAAAELNAPAAIAIDPAGNLYIADSGNNRVRKVSAATGEIATIAGTQGEQFAGDGGPANMASLYGPYALFFDSNGDLLIADMFHNRVRRVSGTAIAFQYSTIRVSKVSPPQMEGLENDGNADLNLAPAVLANAALDPATTTCAPGTLPSNASCAFGVEFAPTVIGNPVLGSVTVNSDAGNSPDVIDLSGQVLTVEPTSVLLTSSANPSLLNAPVTLTAVVSSADSSRSGAVTFLDGAAHICVANLDASGSASCTTSALALGQHSITASYAGDANNASSVSPALIQVVKQPATLALSVSPNPAVVDSSVTLTVTATAATGTPSGPIVFYDGTTTLASVNLNPLGVATYSTTHLVPGSHGLSVGYAGDISDAPAVSNTVSEVITRAPTATSLASSNGTVTVGTGVTLTASVSSANGPAPTGTVQFTDGSAVLGSVPVNSSGLATLVVSSLTPGNHAIVASYSGDVDDAPSSSSTQPEIVQQIGTTTALTSDVNPSSASATVHLTATVSIAAGATPDGPISGQVTFQDGPTILGTAAVSASGAATLGVSTLSAATHTITATYGGSANYATSTSASLVQQVRQTSTSTVLSSDSAAQLAGKTLTLTATISAATGTPTGTVVFRDGGVTIGQATLNAQGFASLSLSALAVGSHAITATYAGDGNYVTSTSAPLAQTISLATTTMTLAGPTNPVDAGTQVSFGVMLTSNGVAPTGALTLRDSGAVIATQTASAAGSFAFNISTLSLGTHILIAAYAGDGDNAASASNSVAVIVRQAPTVTALQSSRGPSVIGQSVTLSASVSSASANTVVTGSISFLDGTTILGSVALAVNGTATFATSGLTFGPHALTAVYSGDANHAASTSLALNEQIVQSANIALASSTNPSFSGINVIFTARVTGVASLTPTGAISFIDGSNLLNSVALDATGAATYQTSTLAVGAHPITASYAGDRNYQAATSTVLPQIVRYADTQIALTASANPSIYGTPVALTALLTTDGGTPTGTVSFTDAGVSIGTALIDSNGGATLKLSSLSPGAHVIIANYGGDGKASSSKSTPLSLAVRQITSTALSSNANPALTLSSIMLTAAVANGGTTAPSGIVTFADGNTQLGTATLDAGGRTAITVPLLAAGNHSLTVSYAGDSMDFQSVSATLTQGVQLRPTSTTLTATETNPSNSQQVTLVSVVRSIGPVMPTGTITFSRGGAVLGSSSIDSTGVATLNIILQSGAASVAASYSGDSAYASSSSLAISVTGGPATQFTLQIDPPNMAMPSKQHGTVNLTIVSVKGFADTLQFGCLGLPFAATCTFSAPEMKLQADGSGTVQLTIDTGNPLGAGAQARRTNSHPSGILLCFLPGGLLACIALWRTRRRGPLVGLLLLACAITATLSVSGCSGLQINGTPPGTYSFKVTAAGQQTGANESQTVTLTVTQ